MSAPKLDRRTARQLTTRELAKVIGAVIGGLVSVEGVQKTRETTRALGAAMTTGDQEAVVKLSSTLAGTILIHFLAGLASWNREQDLAVALVWWSELDETWEEFTKLEN